MKTKKNNNDKSLESYKVFPVVAWILTIGFAGFVYNIAVDLKVVAGTLAEQTQKLQRQVDNPSSFIEDIGT